MPPSAHHRTEFRARYSGPEVIAGGFTDSGRKDDRLFVTDLRSRKRSPSSPPTRSSAGVIVPRFRNVNDEPPEPTVEEMDGLLSFEPSGQYRIPVARAITVPGRLGRQSCRLITRTSNE